MLQFKIIQILYKLNFKMPKNFLFTSESVNEGHREYFFFVLFLDIKKFATKKFSRFCSRHLLKGHIDFH